MDALQAQAMSIEARRRREVQLNRIHSALQRLADGDFGDCLRCREPIDRKRLEYDPAAFLCIGCATDIEG